VLAKFVGSSMWKNPWRVLDCWVRSLVCVFVVSCYNEFW